VLGAVGVVVANFVSASGGRVLIALAAVAVPTLGQEFVRRVLYTRSETRAAVLNDAVSYGLQVGGAFAFAFRWADGASASGALLVFGGSSLAGVLLGVWQLRDHVRFRHGSRGWFGRTWSEVWNFGKWLTAQNILAWLGLQGHAWIIGLMLGVEQVGLYRAITHLANLMNPVRQVAYSYLPSRGSVAYQVGSVAGLKKWVGKTSRTLLLALLPFCIVLVGFPDWVLHLAYGERYAGSDLALLLALATVAQCFTFAKFPFDLGLLALRSTKSIFYAHLIPVVLLLTAGVGLIAILGLVGVPLANMVINGALLIGTWFAYAQVVKRRSRDQRHEASR